MEDDRPSVQDEQRTRVLEVMAEIMAERGGGAGSASVTEILTRAGVSEAVYAKLFGDRETALLAAFDLGVERAAASVYPPFAAEPRWLDAIKAGLAGFLRFLEAEPALGRLLVVYSMGGGERVLRRRIEVLGVLGAILDRGRSEGPARAHQPAEVVAEGVLGATHAIIHNELLASSPRPPIELFGSLVSVIVLPYLGAAVARREISRPAPPPHPRVTVSDRGDAQAWPRVRMSLTYRTRRVLVAIRDYPGASNREVAERAGIVDQGQISKLLTRLQARRMIEKAGGRRTRGAPNSWRLTDLGRRELER